VPVIKAISLEDERVLFIVTGVLLNDCEPLTQFKMPSVPVQENAVFVLCIESNVIRELLLIESIRAFAGKLRDLEIFAVAPRPQNAGLRAALSERESTCDRLVGNSAQSYLNELPREKSGTDQFDPGKYLLASNRANSLVA
jgi:hypothetical protein